MQITRRALLGFGFSGIFAAASRPAAAGRFSDDSGLAEGRFVWQSAAPADGAVLIVVTSRQNVIHVYRGGRLAGLARLKGAQPAGRHVSGVYALADQRRERPGSGVGSPRLIWRADEVFADASVRPPLTLLADDFANLLFRVTERGATVVQADERGEIERIATSGFPLLRSAAGRDAGEALAGRALRPIETADSMGHEAALLVSLRSRTALLVRAGVVEASTGVEIGNGTPVSGSYVYALAGPSEQGAGLQWIAMPLARGSRPSGMASGRAAAVLDGLSFADERAGLALVHELGRGALIHVTDAPLSRSRRFRRGVEVLSNRLPPETEAVAGVRATQGHNTHARAGSRSTRLVDVLEPTSDSHLARQMFDSTRY